MPTRDTPFSAGTPCWVDLMSSDAAASTAFYTALFGWEADAPAAEFGNYVNFTSGGHRVAGLVPADPGSGAIHAWSTYFSTDDAEATAAVAADAGAQLLFPPAKVADLGSMAVLLDPAGAAFGLWQPGTHTGFGRYAEPGSVAWIEHHSKDYAASRTFYPAVFGWQLDVLSDTDEFRYCTAKVPGETDPVAGLMDSASFLPEQVPSHWAVYFNVADADASSARLIQLGGTVVRPAEDTPFGRIADVSDPHGGSFRLHQAPPDATPPSA